MLKKSIYTITFLASLSSASCWTSVELSEFAQDEFDDIARVSIKDAVTCKPIGGVSFKMLGQEFTSDANGIVTLPLPPKDMDAQVPASLVKEGYADQDENVMVTFGSYWNNLFLMSKTLPIKSARFVLSWSAKPADLDLHLVSNDYHISFRQMKSYKDNAMLDRDAMQGYGAETITLNDIDKSKSYKLLVHRYSHDANIDTKTQVRVYAGDKLDRVVRLDESGAECFEVAKIEKGKITYQTKLSQECKK